MKKENMLAAMMFGGQAGGGGGNADTFVVKVTEALPSGSQSYTYSFDHTAEETRAALADGKYVRLIIVEEDGEFIGTAEPYGASIFYRVGIQKIAEAAAPVKATAFNCGGDIWTTDNGANYLIANIDNTEAPYCPMIYDGHGINVERWHYYLDLSSMFENYVFSIEAMASTSPDGKAYLTATIPDGVSPYEDLAWLIEKVKSEFFYGQNCHTSWFMLTTVSHIVAPVTMISSNQFTMTFTDVQPMSNGTADIFDVTINLCASISPNVISVTIGARHYISTAYTPS